MHPCQTWRGSIILFSERVTRAHAKNRGPDISPAGDGDRRGTASFVHVKAEVWKAHGEREGDGRMSSEFRVLLGGWKRAPRERGTRAHSGILFSYGIGTRELPLIPLAQRGGQRVVEQGEVVARKSRKP